MIEQSTALIWAISIMLVAYLGVIVYIAKVGIKHSQSSAGFMIARGAVNPWVVGASFAATYASANLFLGVPGWAYTYGAPVLWWSLGCFGLTWIGLMLFARRFWEQAEEYGKGQVLTLPHWFRFRYNSKLLQATISFLALFNIYYIVGQNVGLATLFETVMGVPYVWGVVLSVAVTIGYLCIGGAYAQFISDGLQGVVMAIISVIMFVSLFWVMGGWDFLGQLKTELSNIDESLVAPIADNGPFFSYLAILCIQWLLFTFGLLPHLMNKVLTLDKKADLRPFTLSAGITLFLLSCFSVFAGMAARVLAPELDTADSAIPVYIAHAFSPVMIAVMITGILAAVLSTTNSLYLSLTAIVGNDLYKDLFLPLIRRKNSTILHDKDDKNVTLVSRSALVIIGIVSLFMSLNRPESLSLLTQFGISAIISGVIGPILLGYVWSKANKVGAITSTLCGAGCYILLQLFGIIDNIFIALGFSSIVGFLMMITGSLFSVWYGQRMTYAQSDLKS